MRAPVTARNGPSRPRRSRTALTIFTNIAATLAILAWSPWRQLVRYLREPDSSRSIMAGISPEINEARALGLKPHVEPWSKRRGVWEEFKGSYGNLLAFLFLLLWWPWWTLWDFAMTTLRKSVVPNKPMWSARMWCKEACPMDFALLVYARDLADIRRTLPWSELVPDADLETLIERIGPLPIGSVSASLTPEATPLRGIILGCPIRPGQVPTADHTVVASVLQAVGFAQCVAPVVGLGGWLGALNGHGFLSVSPPTAILSSSGTYLSVVTMLDILDRALHTLDRSLARSSVAIIGAVGRLGAALTVALSQRRPARLLLIDLPDKATLLEQLAAGVSSTIPVSSVTDANAGRAADILFLATRSDSQLLTSEHLKPGAIVIDATDPRNVVPTLLTERPDVLVLDVLVAHPGVRIAGLLNLPGPGLLSPCLAEILIRAALTREGAKAEADIGHLAGRFGFLPAPLHTFGRAVSKRDLDCVKASWLEAGSSRSGRDNLPPGMPPLGAAKDNPHYA